MSTLVFLDRDTVDREDLDFRALESLGRLRCYGTSSREETRQRLGDAEIALTNKAILRAEEMDAAPQLRLIQVVATGVNNIDLDAAHQRGIAVCNVPGYSTEAVAQHVFTCLLNLFTHVHQYAAEPRKWAESPHFTRLDYPISELAGKTLGIVGVGAIGHAVARIARAFGMTVIALEREGSVTEGEIPRLSREQFFAVSDVVSLHCPLTPETQHFINSTTLAMMKTNAILINTGRGGLIDESALIEALRTKRIQAAAVDVLDVEPPPANHIFLQAVAAGMDNLLITPHIAWSAVEARQRLLDSVVANIEAFRAGQDRNRVV